MTVSQFPADRRLAQVKRCALLLNALHGEDANQFWRTEMSTFVATMRRSGADEDEIRLQATLFLRAVQQQLQDAACREGRLGH